MSYDGSIAGSSSSGGGANANANIAAISQKTQQHSQKAAQIAKEQVTAAAVIARDAAASGAWIWPLQGQYHFVTHPTLIKPVLPAILTSTAFTIVVTILLFVFTYLPTVAILAFVSGPFAFIAAIPVIFGEGAAIGITVARIFWLGGAMERLFDEVLLRRGLTKLVSGGRELSNTGGHHGKKVGKLLTKPLERFSKESIIRWLISLPLNLIPVVGPACFFLYNGAKSGPSYHARYFQLKALQHSPVKPRSEAAQTTYKTSSTSNQDGPVSTFNKESFVHDHRGSYSAFGAVAMALNVLIPGGAILCMMGNQVGAALWAAELETAAGGAVTKADKEE